MRTVQPFAPAFHFLQHLSLSHFLPRRQYSRENDGEPRIRNSLATHSRGEQVDRKALSSLYPSGGRSCCSLVFSGCIADWIHSADVFPSSVRHALTKLPDTLNDTCVRTDIARDHLETEKASTHTGFFSARLPLFISLAPKNWQRYSQSSLMGAPHTIWCMTVDQKIQKRQYIGSNYMMIQVCDCQCQGSSSAV